jgi:hypothetical protein
MTEPFHWIGLLTFLGYGTFFACTMVMLGILCRRIWIRSPGIILRTLATGTAGLFSALVLLGTVLIGVALYTAIQPLHPLYLLASTAGFVGLLAILITVFRLLPDIRD